MILQKEIKSRLSYDAESGIFRWKLRPISECKNERYFKAWNKSFCGKVAGTLSHGYVVITIDSKVYRAHWLAWIFVNGDCDIDQIDHINGNRSDNRISNLRMVNNKENSKNSSLGKNNKSGILGVSWDKKRAKWKSRIFNDGKEIHLGRFEDFFEACCARKSAERYYGFHLNHGKS